MAGIIGARPIPTLPTWELGGRREHQAAVAVKSCASLVCRRLLAGHVRVGRHSHLAVLAAGGSWRGGRYRTSHTRGRLNAGGCLFKPLAMGPNEVEDAAAEFNSRVQIVSPPPTNPVRSRAVVAVGRYD